MSRLFVGKSSHRDLDIAVEQAAGRAMEGAGRAQLALVFTTDHYDFEGVARQSSRLLGDTPWVGCCTAGVFAGDELLRRGIVVGVLGDGAGGLSLGVGISGPVSADARAAGRSAVREAIKALPGSQDANRALILLPDAITGNGAGVVRGAAQEAGSLFYWAGGGAGDNLRFMETAQFAHGRAFRDHVVAIALEGSSFGVGIRHGWRPYGPPHMVTRAEGARVIELDYMPAFEVYRQVAAKHGDTVTREGFAAFAMSHPLGVPQADGEHVIRDPLAVEADDSLRCVAEVPEGTCVRVMRGDRQLLLEAARQAAARARSAMPGGVGGAVVFDCVSRSLMLEREIGAELAAFRRELGEDVPLVGCLTFGEVGALGTGVPKFHNKTAVVLTLPP